MIIDIVIIALTNSDRLYEMTQECITSLRASETKHQFNIIIVESNPDDISVIYPYDAHVIKPEQRFNYNEYCKIGLACGNSEWVALCNNDLVFQPGWFSKILEASVLHPEVSSFSPWNDHEGWHDSRLPGDKEFHFGYGVGYELTGWCLISRRTLFESINLCSRVAFWFSDNIFADELQRLSYSHVLVRNSVVNHITSQTLNTCAPEELLALTSEQSGNYYQ